MDNFVMVGWSALLTFLLGALWWILSRAHERIDKAEEKFAANCKELHDRLHEHEQTNNTDFQRFVRREDYEPAVKRIYDTLDEIKRILMRGARSRG